MMARPPWIISPPAFSLILMLQAGYFFLAEYTRPRLVVCCSTHRFIDDVWRGIEYQVVWVLLCSAAGWVAVWRKLSTTPKATIWPMAIVPIIVGVLLWVVGAAAIVMDTPLISMRGILMLCMKTFVSFMPPVLAILVLWAQSSYWQHLRLRDRPPECECGYDLSGTVSDRCPECASQIPPDLRTSPSLRTNDYPELVLLRSFDERETVSRSLLRHYGNPDTQTIVLVLLPGVALMLTALYLRFWILAAVTGSLLGAAVFLVPRMLERRIRGGLREEIRLRGITECVYCGRHIEREPSDDCPACRCIVAPAEASDRLDIN